MAKKNSTKTATKEALKASEPRLTGYAGWSGVNIKESPLGWNPLEQDYNESALKDNYLVVQNNLITTSSKSLETRQDSKILATPPSGLTFTGVVCLRNSILYAAFSDSELRSIDLSNPEAEWKHIASIDPDGNDSHTWTCIGHYQTTLICLTNEAEIYIGSIEQDDNGEEYVLEVRSSVYIPNPTLSPTLKLQGGLTEGSVAKIQIGYTYVNRFGTTENIQDYALINVSKSPVEWSGSAYLQISGNANTEYGSNFSTYDILAVDLYCRLNENQDEIFIGRTDVAIDGSWSYNWLGALSDTSVWTSVSLTVPTENTTKGVNASFFRQHDGRLYFWGGDEKHRLYIGGNPGNELSVARGLGGAYVDIEPGSGTEIHGTAKFKTYNGASIVTIMCGSSNSGSVKRFNLLENTLTVTNEISSKSYSTEEVANVVGCNSDWGYGVWADGLYAVNRYGLMLTTQAMESNNQLRAQPVSDVIQPLFTDIVANRLNNARIIYIDDIIYVVFGDETNDPYSLDKVILCYDINQKAWYTFTYDLDNESNILHIINIDSWDMNEGIGVITENTIGIIPTTGSQDHVAPTFEVCIETGELSSKQPPVNTTYLCQLELHFDYFLGEAEITIDGVDYYGRRRTIKKRISESSIVRNYPVWLRIDEKFFTYKMTIKGKARFRMTHFVAKTYVLSNKINLVYGYDEISSYIGRDGHIDNIHHYLDSYNNLRETILP